ncbi:hypothetical protein [Corynebacterium sp. AOP12-C2-36]|uniref:hypothetical protein n=1 Tax=Corynebacterium sp. AOP12-C2-36 TaxID=3457723 RepID=UPI004034DA92
MSRRRRVAATVLMSAAVVLLTGATSTPTAGSTAVTPQPVGAVAAAETLAAGEPGTSYLPAELVAELGYRPGTQEGTQDSTQDNAGSATNPTGDCSSPVPLPESFEPACMTHDLGYDLLRVAHRTGETIPEHTRAALDRQMAAQMAASCDGATACRAVAGVAYAGVAVNTVRQHNGAPVEEWFPW